VNSTSAGHRAHRAQRDHRPLGTVGTVGTVTATLRLSRALAERLGMAASQGWCMKAQFSTAVTVYRAGVPCPTRTYDGHTRKRRWPCAREVTYDRLHEARGRCGYEQ
jgi:hypothetical protein